MQCYIHFRFKNGSNPYISTAYTTLFDMICKYDLTPDFKNGYYVESEHEQKRRISYNDKKQRLRDFAVMWQDNFNNYAYDYYDLTRWGGFFEEYGKKYGLLREFRENGIC